MLSVPSSIERPRVLESGLPVDGQDCFTVWKAYQSQEICRDRTHLQRPLSLPTLLPQTPDSG